MNIQNIKELKTTDGWVDLVATILECNEIKAKIKSDRSKSPGEQYNIQKLKVKDNTGTIGIFAIINKTFQFLPGQQVKVHGIVKEYQNNKYLHYCELTLMQGPQNVPQDGQQAAGPTNEPQNAPETANQLQTYDATRNDALALAVGLAARGVIEKTEIYTQADDFINYIVHKKHPQEIAGVKTNPPIEDENWPPTEDWIK